MVESVLFGLFVVAIGCDQASLLLKPFTHIVTRKLQNCTGDGIDVHGQIHPRSETEWTRFHTKWLAKTFHTHWLIVGGLNKQVFSLVNNISLAFYVPCCADLSTCFIYGAPPCFS